MVPGSVQPLEVGACAAPTEDQGSSQICSVSEWKVYRSNTASLAIRNAFCRC